MLASRLQAPQSLGQPVIVENRAGAGSTLAIRLLAITLPQRVSFLKDVPTLNEAGLSGYEYSAWYGVMAPAGTPAEIINRLNEAIAKIINTPEMKELLNKGGLEPHTNTPREFAAFVKSQLEKSRKLIKIAGIPAE